MQFINRAFNDLGAYLIRYHVWFRPIAEIPMYPRAISFSPSGDTVTLNL